MPKTKTIVHNATEIQITASETPGSLGRLVKVVAVKPDNDLMISTTIDGAFARYVASEMGKDVYDLLLEFAESVVSQKN